MPIQQGECKNLAVYEEVNSIVFEYLELNGLEKTLTAFANECRAKSLPCPFNILESDSKAAFSQYDAEKLIKCFDEGDLDGFIKLWKIFQTHIQVTSNDMKKLEVYLRVHFSIWPRAHGEPETLQNQAMNYLKVFFEDQSANLSNDSAVLPLFALPFVADPMSHPIFRDLFQPQWTQKLRGQLETTLFRYFELLQENIGSHSKLAAMVVKSQNGTPPTPTDDSNKAIVSEIPMTYHQDRFFQLVAIYRKIRKLLKGTRESYGKLLKITSELIFALEQSVDGNTVSLDPILQNCYMIFPEIFTPENAVPSGKPDIEFFKNLAAGAEFDKMLDSDVSLFFLGLSDMSPDSLDFPKIQSALTSEQTSQSDKLCLMQALRWLLTKTTTLCRQQAIDSFATNDLLGLSNEETDTRTKIFSCMLFSTPTYMKECCARLLNAFASTRSGRNYLSSTNYCLEVLVKSLQTFKDEMESFICQMVVATLQKLSLRKKMRVGMIDRNVIQWLVVQMKSDLAHKQKHQVNSSKESTQQSSISKGCKFNPYLMEYAWALLMNLCLHDEAMGPTTTIAPDILTCIIETLLAKPSREVAPYVISTLYSLLRNPNIFNMAKRMQLENTFATILAQQDSDISQHLNQVISILYIKGHDRLTASSEVDYDDDENPDPDEFEPELELPETWMTSLDENSLTGDDLLIREYLIQKEEVVVPFPTPKTIEKPGIFVRPVTPSSVRNSRERVIKNETKAKVKRSKSTNTRKKIGKTIKDKEAVSQKSNSHVNVNLGVIKQSQNNSYTAKMRSNNVLSLGFANVVSATIGKGNNNSASAASSDISTNAGSIQPRTAENKTPRLKKKKAVNSSVSEGQQNENIQTPNQMASTSSTLASNFCNSLDHCINFDDTFPIQISQQAQSEKSSAVVKKSSKKSKEKILKVGSTTKKHTSKTRTLSQATLSNDSLSIDSKTSFTNN